MMGCNKIITITRQFGSGGHEIGAALAERLGIGFYDKELISLLDGSVQLRRGLLQLNGRFAR